MHYFGGKARISKDLSIYLQEQLSGTSAFVDLFCGSCNVISKIDFEVRIANDKHEYLIEMFKGLQKGWIPPESVSEEDYKLIRGDTSDKPLHGFVGFGLSYSGKWWGGYCRDGSERNYALNAKNSLMKKINNLKNVSFYNEDYRNVVIPEKSLIYCDTPYKGSTKYSVGDFDFDAFYSWGREMTRKGHKVLCSEYKHNLPEGCSIVWSKDSRKDIRDKDGVQVKTTEILYKFD
jgi:DNA adenine methylase